MSRPYHASLTALKYITALPSILLALACGNDSGTNPGLPAVASVQVSPIQQAAVVGEEIAFEARAFGAAGQEITGRAVTWSSGNPTVATVSTSGMVIAHAVGTAHIKATIGGKMGSGELNVSLAPVATVSLEPAQLNLIEGETQVLVAIAKDAAGRVLDGRTVAWTSISQNVVSVSNTGLVTALSVGTTEIVATIEGKTGRSPVMVGPASVFRVELSAVELTMGEGDEGTVTAVAKDAAGRPLHGRRVTWDSSDPSVVSVDVEGRLVALQFGRAQVTATIEGKSAAMAVSVTRAAVASVDITPGAFVMEVGESRQMTAIVRDAAGRILAGRPIQWSTTDGAFISPNGLVTAVRPGYLTINAAADGMTRGVAATVVEAESYAFDLLYHRQQGNGQSELFRLTVGTGTAPIRLNAGAVSRNATSSPDGMRVAFAVSQEDLTTRERIDDIFAVDVNGMNMKRLTSQPGYEDSPAWSPIGGRIAYHHYEIDGRSDIWVMSSDGTGQMNLTADMPVTGFRSSPAWSADGSRIAFAQLDNADTGTTASIWTMRADGSDRRQLTSTTSGFDSRPTWSPDGQGIAFMRYYEGGEADISVIGVSGGAVRRIALPGLQSAPAWSPDGALIAFVQEGAPLPYLYTMRPDGTQVRLRTLDKTWGGGLSPTWIRNR